jgi:hypothetical protein
MEALRAQGLEISSLPQPGLLQDLVPPRMLI